MTNFNCTEVSSKEMDSGFTSSLFIISLRLFPEYSSEYIFNFSPQVLLMLYNKVTSSPALIQGISEFESISKLPFSLTETSDTLKSSMVIFLFWFMEAVIPI